MNSILNEQAILLADCGLYQQDIRRRLVGEDRQIATRLAVRYIVGASIKDEEFTYVRSNADIPMALAIAQRILEQSNKGAINGKDF